MLLGLYGLTGEQPVLRYMWLERELVSGDYDLMSHSLNDAKRVDAAVDQIMCRSDGTFQIVTKGYEQTIVHDRKRTEALGEKTSVFLQMVITMGRVSVYTPIDDQPKHPSVRMDVGLEQRVLFHAMFSGVDYDVDAALASTLPNSTKNHEYIRWNSKTLKGTLIGERLPGAEDAQGAWPHGTLLSVKFPVGEKEWRVKSFLFD